MRKLLSWLLVAVMVLTLLPTSVLATETEHTPDEFGWGSDGTDWTYWTATEDSIRFLDANAANAAGANGRVWKNILVNSEYTFSFDLKVDPNARVYISFQGVTLECGANAAGQYWIPQVGNWLAPADGFVHFEISRADDIITVKANPSDGTATEWTMEPTNTSANVEIGMWNSDNNGFEVKNISYTVPEEPPAEVHTPDEFGWGSDGTNWTYWTATEDSIRFLDANAANAAGANGRVWKSILANSAYIFSFDLKVDPNARVYISFQGVTLECGANAAGQYWIPQVGNWLAPADGFVHFEITRADDVITVKANPSDGTATEWTMTPANASANVEIGMWNSDNNGFEIKNISYTQIPELEIVSASLRLDEDIDVIYTVLIPDGYTDAYMVINGTTITVSEAAGDYRRFVYTGITPQRMTDNISATLYATKEGTTESDSVASYSIKQYCANLLAAYPNETALVTLLSDLLTYGAAAQTYTNYNTNDLATSGLTLSPSAFSPISGKAVSFTGTADAGTYWTEATLVLGNTVGMRLYFVTDAQISIDVTIDGSTETFDSGFVSCGSGKYYLDVPGIQATDFDTTVSAVFYDNGEPIGNTLNYTVNAYICGTQNSSNATLQALVRALYNYGASAAAYAAE